MTGREVIKVLQKHGYHLDHVSGSHHIMKKAGATSISVPVHGKKDLSIGTLRSIERDSEIQIRKQRKK